MQDHFVTPCLVHLFALSEFLLPARQEPRPKHSGPKWNSALCVQGDGRGCYTGSLAVDCGAVYRRKKHNPSDPFGEDQLRTADVVELESDTTERHAA